MRRRQCGHETRPSAPTFRRQQWADIAKIIEVVGSSPKSWDEAAENAVRTASKTINNITGVEVEHMTAKVEGGEIVSYKTTVKSPSASVAEPAIASDLQGRARRRAALGAVVVC